MCSFFIEKRTIKDMELQKIRGKKTIGFIVLIVVIIVVILCIFWPHPISKGEKYIREQAGKSVDDMTQVLAEKRAQEIQIANANGQMNIYDLLDSYAILGDSRAVMFQTELDPNRVMAEIGVKINNIDHYLSALQTMQPRFIYVMYGLNDIASNLNGTEGGYGQIVTEEGKKIMDVCPNSKLFLISILPVQSDQAMNDQVNIYNEALRQAAQANGWTYIDCTDLVADDYYEGDGEHFKASFYPLLAERMYEAQESTV